MTASKPNCGFIGLGLMGGPIALKLLELGYPLTVWGRDRAKLEPALAAGATAADSAEALTRSSEIVFLCVTDTKAVEAIVFGEAGVAAGGTSDKLLIDHSSIRPDATRDMAARLADDCGMTWLDAPVSGGAPGVANKTLAVMAGGSAEAFSRAAAVVNDYAGRFTHMGPIGAGQTTKLINQVLVGVGFATLAEVAGFARNAGIDAAQIPQALAGGRADSRLLQEFLPRMAARDFEPKGRIDIMLKDLNMVSDVARESGSSMPVTEIVTQLHRLLAVAGRGGEDNAATVKLHDRGD